MHATLTPGTVVALRYRIKSLLGTGGMASVYRAYHWGLRQDVALKVLAPELSDRLGGRFEREARAAARLDHPGCVRVLDYGRWVDRSRYLAMELLPGDTLADHITQYGAFSTAAATRIVREVLFALAHSHARKILHRDVKPSNIMFARRDGAQRAVLIDFGLARVHGESALTAAGAVFGSPSYIAPERLLGRPYDMRADLYSVGVMLYELLAGVRPFVGDNGRDIALNALQYDAPWLRALRPDVSPALADVVHRALAKDPRRRFADAEMMLSALDAAPTTYGHVPRQRPAHPVDESTAMVVELGNQRPSAARRLWRWWQFGAWRWRMRGRVRCNP